MVHRFPIAVRFYELDPYSHLNHSVYIQYFETARIDLLAEAGFDLTEMADRGRMIVVTEIRTRFLASATMGDEVVVETEVVDTKRVTTRWRQRMYRDGELIAEQDLFAAMTNLGGRPVRLLPELVAALEPYRVDEPSEKTDEKG